jgi:hypothetical protein
VINAHKEPKLPEAALHPLVHPRHPLRFSKTTPSVPVLLGVNCEKTSLQPDTIVRTDLNMHSLSLDRAAAPRSCCKNRARC